MKRNEGHAVYIVTLKQAPEVHYIGDDLKLESDDGIRHGGGAYGTLNKFNKPRREAEKLSRRQEVANVVLDFSVRTATTHTPKFLGLPLGAWVEEGGPELAGEGIVIGFVDTGIDPTHPSFSDDISEHVFPILEHFSGICEVTSDFPSGSCNRKLIGACHFSASAITRGIFNASQDYASPFDGDGHGSLSESYNPRNAGPASIRRGNHGILSLFFGHPFGSASGMAPRSHISVYKALYKSFGGFAADVVAAIDQVHMLINLLSMKSMNI
ncbi:hypothetical protein IFM89_036474 [Coptis chinensis]|uniref:Peptidase S8/S53 domain-containing protein n=1 Tax=Coptis chinensis TaxID=261450 RepID=A0A835IZX9_9MAGN|nr:hypothetical protein IFM89_036474 [Coptis chinensis]